ncbi:MAG TPA: hypothetical protein VGD69_00080 [Herpetosiphonaceae bacterium]
MHKHVLHDPSANSEITRRVETADSTHDQERSFSAAPDRSHAITGSSAHIGALQRLSLSGQQNVLLHLNRTQGNRQVQRLAQAMQQRNIARTHTDASAVVQRVPGIEEVDEIDDYLPNCVLDLEKPDRKTYKRDQGKIKGESDTDLFYRDGDGPLVPITVAMVNAFFDPRYEGFEKISGPDWSKNCEDYAKASGFGAKIGDYTSSATLIPLVRDQGTYVLELSHHWMRVHNTNGSSVTIRQKDGESAVYERTYDSVETAAAYILTKRGAGGTVYATG